MILMGFTADAEVDGGPETGLVELVVGLKW